MRTIKWGIIGLGGIANKLAQAVTSMSNVELVAVASRSKEKSETFGNKYGVTKDKCYGSYDEIVKDEEVEVIYVAVPHNFHKELSILCLKNSKAVLCEKPVTISEEEIREVIKVAEENKVFFMEAMKTRFLPVHRRAKELIEEGKIGEVRLLQADFGSLVPFDPEGRIYNKDLAGGALLDVGVYNISYSAFIFGNKPKAIDSTLYIGKTGVDENVSVTLTYENGEQAQLYGAVNAPTIREANIIGTKGRICIPRYSSGEKVILISDGKEEVIDLPFEINGFEYQIEEVSNCIREGKLESKVMSWQDSIEVMKIMDEVARGKRV